MISSGVVVAKNRRLVDLAAPALWSLYFLWGAPAWPWFSGVALSALSPAAVAAVWWLWAIRRRLPFLRIVAVLTLVKIVVAPAVLDRGFRASYYANASWQGSPEA